MTTKERIFERYEKYEDDYKEISKVSSKFTARVTKVLIGNDSKEVQQLHCGFFTDVEALVADFVAEEPSEADADQVAAFMLREKSSDPRDVMALSLLAAEKFAISVIPFMSESGKAELLEQYNKRDRMIRKSTIGKAVTKALK
jgi:hypothetical protein